MAAPMTPIAVVGVSAIFPGSTTTGGFWKDIVEGRDRLTEVPRSHWLREDYFDEKPGTPDKVYATRGGFIPEVDFSPMEFGLPPNAVPATDTAQLLALVVAKRVLVEATRGRYESVDRSRMSVILGVASATELVAHMSGRLQKPVWERAMRSAGLSPEEVTRVSHALDECYVPWQENTFPGLLGNVVAGRITNRLDLGGTNAVVDAACAGSLAAVSMAVNDLALGNSDLVITGGVDALNDILMYMCFAQTGALSTSGDCRPFSEESDGTILGEGIGMLALRRLDDAERDGDAIYAVLRGLGSSSDGRAKSIYAPSAQGQTLALKRAYERAGFGPETVGLVEAHGTGTLAGDAAEFEALASVFDEAGAARRGCALGSVKSQLGHTKAAAGSAGMIKAILALHHKLLPPTLKVRAPNPKLGIDQSAFHLNTEARPWIATRAHPRRASVSALGFGGTNFHVALEEYSGPAPRPKRLHASPVELVVLTAGSPAALAAACQSLRESQGREGALVHLAKSSQIELDPNAHARVAIVAIDEADLVEKLALAAEAIERSGEAAFVSPRGVYYQTGALVGGVALLFPGQGSQYVGMGADLAMRFDAVREIWDDAATSACDGDVTLPGLVFPRPVFDDAAHAIQDEDLTATQWAQPAITAMSLGILTLLERLGVQADVVGGHSLGEVTAAVAAGCFDVATAITVARRRGELMASVTPISGAMTAVVSDREAVQLAIEGLDVVVANHNSPRQVVLSGARPEIERAERRLEEASLAYRRLPVSTAFHSPLVSDSVVPFRAFLEGVSVSSPRIPYYANATAAPYSEVTSDIRAQLAQAIASPVRFAEQVDAMYAAGARTFIEVGPDAVLTRLIARCLEGRPHLAVAIDQRGQHGITALLTALGRLAVAGVPLTFAPLWAEESLPDDPATHPPAKLSIRINGANHGKPYPPKNPEVATRDAAPGPAPAVATQVDGPPAPAVTTPVARPPAPTPAPAEPVASEAASDSNESLHRLHAPIIAAQMEFQRLMAESHIAFLNAIQCSYTSVAPNRNGAMASSRAMAEPLPIAPMPVAVPAPVVVAAHALALAPIPVVVAAPAPVPAPIVVAAPALRQTLLAIVAEKTGYPAEMIDVDMDLEADLGIDSIKRVEILSAMRQRVPDLPQVNTARMATMRSLAQIIELVSSSAPVSPAASSPVLSASSPSPAAPATVGPLATPGVEDLTPVLLSIVAEKTGYPAEMIGLEMDLEADLGIDSIKRVEILSAMRQRVPALPQVNTARMATMRSLGQIVQMFDAPALAPAAGPPLTTPTAAPTAPAAPRAVVRAVATPASGFATPGLFGPGPIMVTADGAGVARALASRLREIGVNAVTAEAIPSNAAGVIFLGGLRAVDEATAIAVNREAFATARAVAGRFRERGGLFVTVQDTGGDFGLGGASATRAWLAGVGALAKTAAEEWPMAVARALDIERGDRSDDAVAAAIVAELVHGGPEIEVGLDARGERVVPTALVAELSSPPRAIEAGAVFVVTGGARGVTAASLVELARTAQPRLLILGRTPIEAEPPALRDLADEAALKRAAMEDAKRLGLAVTPKEIGTKVAKILAAREVEATIAALKAAGSAVRYAPVDVRDVAALGALLEEVRREWGPVRGIVHGAGVLADAFLDMKTDAQFGRVFDTKVLGLRALLDATRHDPLQWLCLFSSVAARTGNAGQSDYAMANEVLNKVAASEARRRGAECRVVSIGWGPWDGGMVTPSLRDHFAERGVALLPLASGAHAFVRELGAASDDAVEVIVGGDDMGLRGARGLRMRGSVSVSAKTHPHLDGHRIQGKPVLPMVYAIEWFARLTRALFPARAVDLRNVRVLRGVTLSGFEGAGDSFTLASGATDGGHAATARRSIPLELRDAAEALRYSATIDVDVERIGVETFGGPLLPQSPWTREQIYSQAALFHGREFQVIQAVEGLSPQGASATLMGTMDAGWPREPWCTDPATLDGALQLAILCGLRTVGGPTLPMRIGHISCVATPVTGSSRCHLWVRSTTPERMVCDIALEDASGAIYAKLGAVEMYAIPSATGAS